MADRQYSTAAYASKGEAGPDGVPVCTFRMTTVSAGAGVSAKGGFPTRVGVNRSHQNRRPRSLRLPHAGGRWGLPLALNPRQVQDLSTGGNGDTDAQRMHIKGR